MAIWQSLKGSNHRGEGGMPGFSLPTRPYISGPGTDGLGNIRLFSFCVIECAEHLNPSYLLKLRKISPRILILSIVCFYIHFSSPKNFNKR